ncbi:MAG: DUF489 family protein [Gammaproteobacteria bacterium]|jgi:high frequency lysogenization protein|nr:DUF489 family protein [Gammaproteobacteria bacterium]
MNRLQQQTLALAGVMQAVCQIEDIANRGMTDIQATNASLSSILQQSAHDLSAAIGSSRQLRFGLQRMVEVLQGERKYLPALQYAMAVMQLEQNLRRSQVTQQAVARELQLIASSHGNNELEDAAADDDDDYAAPMHGFATETISQLADVWSEQVRQLQPQVVVHGKPLYLQNEKNVQVIRALLLAALRCSWLWRQLGGKRWHLLLRRKHLLTAARQILQA